ncbi:MAG: VanW family protein [Bacillota bacterium]
MLVVQRRPALLLALMLALAVTGCLSRVERLFFGVKPGVRLAGRDMGGMLLPEVRKAVRALSEATRQEAVNADVVPGKGDVVPEAPGRELDVPYTVALIMAAATDAKVEPVYNRIDPAVTAGDIALLKHTVSAFVTFAYGSAYRLGNIRIAASSIDHSLLLPGEVFSFNERVGPRTHSRGFRPAPVIGGIGYGGGVCQLSTTIYNTALAAGLTILERHPHSRPVPYVPIGRDATVSYPDVDMRFVNSSDGPLLLRARLDEGRVVVKLIGRLP